MQVKISVVIPTYNRPDLLCRCLEALFIQSIPREFYEILVVSDGPDQLTKQVLEQLDKPYKLCLKLLSTPEKKGPAAVRNIGWLQAKGPLIAFTDDDCVPDKDWLRTILETYNNEEEIVYTGRITVPIPKKPTDYELNVYKLETAEFVTANCICTKKVLIKIGGFDERFCMAWREDSDLHFKLLEHHIPIIKIQANVCHPVRQTKWGISIKEQKKGLYNALLYKNHPKLYRQRIKPRPSWNYYLMVLGFLGFVIAVFLNLNWLALIGTVIWLWLTTEFIAKRLAATTHSSKHVLEIIITSIAIPFLSIYWQLYGAIRYRVFFI